MTEASPALAGPHIKSKDTATVGSPVMSSFGKVIDINTGKSLPAGETGELCFKGPQVCTNKKI
jgi:long-subunit acyl-CoA synthetase (AMP-forming)